MERGTIHFFLCQKEKSSKKEVGDLAGRMLASVEAVYRKAHSALRGSLRKRRTIRLAKGCFAARGSLGDFDRMEAFLLVRSQDCVSPKSLFHSLGACTVVPLSVVLRDCM